MNFRFLNNITGWTVFLIATIVYFTTLEPTSSLWDCGEYITAAHKLEVGHPPGAPLFMAIGRLFSFFAEPGDVALWVNRCSSLCSSFTILFLFWSISLLAKKILNRNNDWANGEKIVTLGAGAVGALAYAFSDSFWFSAVEGEVYAMAAMFTAIIFWAILKWDDEVNQQRLIEKDANGTAGSTANPLRWLILIMYLNGLAIGVHLLGLLVIPAIGFVIYFNYYRDNITIKGFLITGLISFATLGLLQGVFIPIIPAIASMFEVGFVNGMGLPFYAGTIFFFVLLIALMVFTLNRTTKRIKPIWNTVLWSVTMLLIGYGSFAIIVIRSNANTPLDENDPENLVTLHSYLKREQYGSWPVFSGPYWNSNQAPREEWKDMSASNLRRFVVIDEMAETDVKAFKTEAEANAYNSANGNKYTIKEKYFVSNESIRKNAIPTFEENVLFPRMFNGDDKGKLEAYKFWSGYNSNVEEEERNQEVSNLPIGIDGKRIPSYGENMTYMFKYQLTWMYWRYFMWNFAGRQNDIQGHGDVHRGNWKSGYSFIDNDRIGEQSTAPYYTITNKANNTYFMIPLILGILGALYHFYRNAKDGFVITLLFLLTGVAIVLFLNPKPLEPRERDYAYAGSFYAFSFWIGLSVLAIYEAYKTFVKADFIKMAKYAGYFTALILLFTIAGTFAILKAWILILVIAALFMAVPYFLRKTLNNSMGAGFAVVLGLIAPFLMMKEGWNDHDRSGKTSAQDLAYNYLISCAPNSIIFTMGDNDTFPLWYMQEVEDKFTDMRVCNTSLFATDWYAEQMKMKAYESEPLPIKFREDQILMYAGSTDQVLFGSPIQLVRQGGDKKVLEKVFQNMRKNNLNEYRQSVSNYLSITTNVLSKTTAGEEVSKDPTMKSKIDLDLAQIAKDFSINVDSASFDQLVTIDQQTSTLIELANGGMITLPMQSPEFQQMQEMMNSWTKSWSVMPLDEAMAFVRDDKNLIVNEGRELRIIPASSFTFKVNINNAIQSQVISAKEKSLCEKEIQFSMDEVQGVGKADLLILDIIANNDWKRGIYFSSPGGSDVAGALYRSGFLKENGMAWELSPIRSKSQLPVNAEKMYKNLMEVYHYGDLKNPDVLTDYYARRQTQQFRSMFAQLAEYYMVEVDNLESGMNSVGNRAVQFRAAGMTKVADSIDNIYKNAPAKIKEYKLKTKKLIMRSLEVMPVDLVLDNGEQASRGRALPQELGANLFEYSDGNLHDYIGLLYRAGAKKEAEDLGLKVTAQLETILDHFVADEAGNVLWNRGVDDLSATILNYAKIMRFVDDPKLGNPTGKLATQMHKRMSKFYGQDLNTIILNANGNSKYDLSSTTLSLKLLMNAYDVMYEISGQAQMPTNSPQGANEMQMQGQNDAALMQPVAADCLAKQP